MKRFNLITLISVLLVSCSSPPEPTKVEWDKPAAAVNKALPDWHANDAVIPSPVISGRWSRKLTNWQGDAKNYPSDVWYAIAHSTRIVVTAPSGSDFFNTRRWLRQNGANGLIEYQPAFNCLTCKETTIYFSR